MYAHVGLNQLVAANIANAQKVNVKTQKQQKIVIKKLGKVHKIKMSKEMINQPKIF